MNRLLSLVLLLGLTGCSAGPEASVEAATEALHSGDRLRLERFVDLQQVAGSGAAAEALIQQIGTHGKPWLVGIRSSREEGDLAEVEAWFRDSTFLRDSVTVRFRLQRQEGEWTVVRVMGLDTLESAVLEAQLRSAARSYLLTDPLELTRAGCTIRVEQAGLVLRSDGTAALFAPHTSTCEPEPLLGISGGVWSFDPGADITFSSDSDPSQGLRLDPLGFTIPQIRQGDSATIHVDAGVWGDSQTLEFVRGEIQFDTAVANPDWAHLDSDP